jgi:hypothetical protein
LEAREPTASVWPSIRKTSHAVAAQDAVDRDGDLLDLPALAGGMAAEPKAKLIDWMSIDGAMRRSAAYA